MSSLIASANDSLKQALGESLEVLMPPPDLSPSEWANEYRFLSAESAPEPGKYSTDRAPYQKGILDSVRIPDCEEVVFIKSSQVGGTEIINNVLGYFIHYDPAPILFVLPTLGIAEDFSKDRIAPMIRDTPALNKIVSQVGAKKSSNTILHKSFPGGQLTLAGANSPASLASRPKRIILFDELDRMTPTNEGDPVSLAEKRANNFFNRLKFKVSTPTRKGASLIENSWNLSNKQRFHVPCLECGSLTVFSFKKLIFDKNNIYDCYYPCGSCGFAHDNSMKFEMLQKGDWIAEVPSITKVQGFHINELYSPWKEWPEVVEDFLKSKDDPLKLQVFVNTSLGEVWEESGDAPEFQKLYERRESYSVNELPSEEIRFLVAGVDVQPDRFEVEIVAYGSNKESWSIDYRVFPADTSNLSEYKDVEELLFEKWTLPSGLELEISRLAIDSGYNASTVYDWAKAQSKRRVLVVKGFDSQTTITTTPKAIEQNRRGKKVRTGLKLWGVGVSVAKRETYAFLKRDVPEKEVLEKEGFPYGFCHFPKDYPLEYFKGLTAEVEVQKKLRGYTKFQWEKIFDRNEPLDCRVYARAAAETLGLSKKSTPKRSIAVDKTKTLKKKKKRKVKKSNIFG